MMKRVLAFAAFCGALAMSAQATAAVYDFSYSEISGPTESATGSFTTSDTEVGGTFAILSIDGTATDSAGVSSTITGLSSYAGADNLYRPSSPHFSFAGVSFAAADGVDFNLYSSGDHYYVTDSLYDPVGNSAVSTDAQIGRLTVSAAPEPSSWGLMILGAGLMGAALRYSRRGAAVSAAA